MSFRDNRSLNVIKITTTVSCGLFLIAIFGLDITFNEQTLKRASIATDTFNSGVSFVGINNGFYVLTIFFIIGLLFSIGEAFIPKKEFTIFYLSALVLLLLIPREAILYKFITCFNYSNNAIIIARASLTFVLMIFLLALNVLYLAFLREENEVHSSLLRVGRILAFIVTVCSVIAIVVLNILIIVNLKPQFNNDISPYNIDIGYFDKNDISNIESGLYVKDIHFNKRVISKLSDVIFSQNKKLAYRRCSKNSCTSYYLRTLNVNIMCTNETVNFYKDCESASYLTIRMMYLDRGVYPSYNCAKYKNTTCELGCPNLALNYQLYLIQQNSGGVEPAWKGLCNCGTKIPKIDLTEDKEIEICKANNSSNNRINPFFYCSMIFCFLIGKFFF